MQKYNNETWTYLNGDEKSPFKIKLKKFEIRVFETNSGHYESLDGKIYTNLITSIANITSDDGKILIDEQKWTWSPTENQYYWVQDNGKRILLNHDSTKGEPHTIHRGF